MRAPTLPPPPPRRRRRKRRKSLLLSVMGFLFASGVLLFVVGAAGAGFLLWNASKDLPSYERLAEYEHINDPELLARYRRSFGHYTRNRLLISMFYYVTLFALFCGIFIIRYHLELILATPLIAGFIGYYVQVGLKQDSAAQNPERLYRENGLVIFSVICVMAVLFLLFTNIPALYDLFNVEPHGLRPLWRF